MLQQLSHRNQFSSTFKCVIYTVISHFFFGTLKNEALMIIYVFLSAKLFSQHPFKAHARTHTHTNALSKLYELQTRVWVCPRTKSNRLKFNLTVFELYCYILTLCASVSSFVVVYNCRCNKHVKQTTIAHPKCENEKRRGHWEITETPDLLEQSKMKTDFLVIINGQLLCILWCSKMWCFRYCCCCAHFELLHVVYSIVFVH